MPNVDSVTVADLAQNVRLTVLQGEDYLNRQITTSDICRPSLEFAGYFKHYPAMRIQLLGITETSFACLLYTSSPPPRARNCSSRFTKRSWRFLTCPNVSTATRYPRFKPCWLASGGRS